MYYYPSFYHLKFVEEEAENFTPISKIEHLLIKYMLLKRAPGYTIKSMVVHSHRKRRAQLMLEQEPILVCIIFNPERSHGCCLVRTTGARYHAAVIQLLYLPDMYKDV